MTIDDTYNGWVNRETWATALHLSNHEGLYNVCRQMCEDGPRQGAERIKDFVERAVEEVLHPGDEPAAQWVRLMISDVGSFWRVNWDDVAESFMEE